MIKNIQLPDIGDFDEVEVIEILVNVGDEINKEDSIITLESDKASMEIPSPYKGTVTQINISLGDKIKQGDTLISLEVVADKPKPNKLKPTYKPQILPVTVPDIGDFDEVEVIEILVNVGDEINKEDSIITLESDKASMEIPTPIAGTVSSINVNLGDKISLGDLILELKTTAKDETVKTSQTQTQSTKTPPETATKKPSLENATTNLHESNSHASPSIRKLARELGVDLSKVAGTGKKDRVLEADLKSYVKKIITSDSMGSAIPRIPIVDFAKFGETKIQPLSRINKRSGKHLTACWLNVPHVTQFDEVNIEKMQAHRQTQKAKGIKLTPLVFIMKAVVKALEKHPRFNASLDKLGENLIFKKYFNLGIAVDTPNGLVVPVICNVGEKSLTELAIELSTTSENARQGKLKSADMQGGSFTISSLGGIGGTQFVPIVNAPEVAILGVSRAETKPVWNGKKFHPTPMLPLALSYDHRVIDGAQGGRFMADLNKILHEANYD